MESEDDIVFGGFVIRGRAKNNSLDYTYSGYGLRSPAVRSQIMAKGQGAIRANIGQSDLRMVAIPLPPLPEQRAIATALYDMDALINSLDQLIAKKRDIKQAIMQQLLTGKTRLPGFKKKDGFKQTEIGLIPQDWAIERLRSCLIDPPAYGVNAAAVTYSDLLPTYIRITDISNDGKFLPEKRASVICTEADKYNLDEGDIVFARTGASVGKSYLYDLNDGPLIFAGFLIRVAANREKLSPRFLFQYTSTAVYWNWVRQMSMRSGQPGINGNEYGRLPVPLPKPAEQMAISQVLSDMDAELSTLEQRRDKTILLKQGMMQELLTGRTRLV